MAQGNVAIVQQVYKAMKDGDFPVMFSLVAPKVTIWQTGDLPLGDTCDGLDQAKMFFGKVTWCLTPSVELEHLIGSGDFVLDIARTKGATKATGASLDVPLVHLCEVRDEKCTGLRIFFETTAWRPP